MCSIPPFHVVDIPLVVVVRLAMGFVLKEVGRLAAILAPHLYSQLPLFTALSIRDAAALDQ